MTDRMWSGLIITRRADSAVESVWVTAVAKIFIQLSLAEIRFVRFLRASLQ